MVSYPMVSRLIPALLLLAPLLAGAQEREQERFSLSAGAFVTDRDTTIRLDSASGRGTETDVEDVFGLERTSRVLRLDGYFRFRGPHRLDFSVFDLSRDSTKRIEKTIIWGDVTFPVDTVIDSNFGLEIYKAAYTYEFRQYDTGYLGVTGGLYVLDLDSRLVAPDIGQSDLTSLTAPLPVVGLRGEREFAERWKFRASGEFFFLEVDDHKGSLWDLYAVVDYAVFDNVAIGFGFNSVRLNVRSRQSRFDGRIKFRYNGALLFMKFDF